MRPYPETPGQGSAVSRSDVPVPVANAQRVLCYSPYNYWDLHGMWEITVLHALRLRGAEVTHVLCDSMFSDCDVFWQATNPRTSSSCLECMQRVINLTAAMRNPFVWLGRFLTPEQQRSAADWALAVPSDALPSARYRPSPSHEGWELGEWVRSSVHSHFRRSRLDLCDAQVADAYRSYVYSAAVAAIAIDCLLDTVQPHVVFLFSGRMGSTRVALELARARGLRVVCHERGLLRESLKLFRNTHSLALGPIRDLWDSWGHVPLSHDEAARVRTYMDERAHGRNVGENTFSEPPQDLEPIQRRIGWREDRGTWLLLTSSEDEVIANKERAGPFQTQLEWIEATIAHVRKRPDVTLVIRVHPNIASGRSIGKNLVQLEEMRQLAERAPANVHVILPDEAISTYSLMELASLGLVYISITGLEMACRGKQVIVAAGAWVRDLPFVGTLRNQDEYAPMLDARAGLRSRDRSAEVQRLAYRFAYALYFRWNIPFPLVEMPDAQNGKLRYKSLEELAPGRDPGLDRVCRIVLDDEAICAEPSPDDRRREPAEELAWHR